MFRLSELGPSTDAAISDAPIETGWKATATGYFHSCGIRADDTLWCWGANEYSEVGSGLPQKIVTEPTRVGSGRFQAVSSTFQYTCALDLDGGLWCWGLNAYGGLGTGNGDAAATPTRLNGTWKSVSAGGYSTCAIRDDDTLWCWGYNYWGELGLGSTAQTPIPTQVGTATWLDIDIAFYQACGIQTDHSMWCWGENSYGVIGDGTTSPTPITTPTRSAPGSWATVEVGPHVACAIDMAGQLFCWGLGSSGMNGNGMTTMATTPQPVVIGETPPSDWTQLSIDHIFGCAIRQDGSLWCWGSNAHAQLGVPGAPSMETRPVQMTQSQTGWRRVDTGTYQTCAIDLDNDLYCWGNTSRGQLGTGATDHAVPTQMPGTLDKLQLGETMTCGLGPAGTIACAGYNVFGQLGDGTTLNRSIVADMSPPLEGVGNISPGLYHACASTEAATYCWGYNVRGQLGNGTTTASSSPVVAGGALTPLASSEHTCGINAGTIYCWGANSYGQVGNNTAADVLAPVNVGAGVQLDVGSYHSCTVTSSATAYCWGRGSEGQLGLGTQTNSLTPAPVVLTSTGTLSMISTGSLHTCTIATSGRLWCWGYNVTGQLGQGDRNTRVLPTVIGTATWKSVSAGGGHTCGVQTNGTLWCWGRNGRGQLGIGTYIDRYIPSQVGIATDWIEALTGEDHSCATKAGGQYWCWGGNESGQTPDGTAWTPTIQRVP